MTTIVKPVKFTITKGQLDSSGALLQKLDVTHRVKIMSALNGRVPENPSHFGAPAGVATYYGFGADGWYYEGGAQQRTWGPQECIDDFADNVTDTERWDGTISTDFSEGGIDYTTDTPFGKRLYCEYTGPAGVEFFDRKGKMSVTPSGNVILSSRVNTPFEGTPLGANLDNFVGVGIQLSADNTTYVFCGFINTVANPFSVCMGHFDAGVLTIHSVVALTTGVTSVNVAIDLDSAGGTSRGYYSTNLTGQDYDGASWAAIGAAAALPAAWAATAVVPRLHASFASGIDVGARYSIADVRVEKNSDSFLGDMRASWWLEDSDGTASGDISGSIATCPDKLMIVWERSNANACTLTLIDVEDPEDPLVWRRWEGLPLYKPEPFAETDGVPFWSPGWMDADEGHIVMTRNTVDASDDFGEVWVLSLRWDTIVVFGTTGLWRYPIYNDGTSTILRETGSWGSRRWYPPSTNEPKTYDNYDHLHQATTSFVGTLANRGSETAVAAITYGVHVRRCDDDKVYVAYGIQQSPASLPDTSPCYAGVIELSEGGTRQYDRWIFTKNTASDTAWTGTDECWVGVALSSAKVLWWSQALDIGFNQELTGVVCRRDFSADAADNQAASAYTETFDVRGLDRVGASAVNMAIADSDPTGDEVVLLAAGWAGDSWLTGIWYDGGTPANTIVATYGYEASAQAYIPVNGDMGILPPSDKFPEWVLYHTETADAALDLCRVTNAFHRSRQVLSGDVVPVWAGYVKWNGTSEVSYRHAITRGNTIARGDFTLHLSGYFSPPFTSGYQMNASHYMKDGQTFSIRLYIVGERRMYGYIDFYLEGVGGGASPTLEARSAFQYQVGDGTEVSVSATYSLGTWGIFPDRNIRLRIKRFGQTIQFLIYDHSTSNYEVVLSNSNMLYGPVMCGMEVRQGDMPDGLAAGTMVEIDQFLIRPPDDLVGSVNIRPVDYPVLVSHAASVAGGDVNRDAVPTGTSGNLAIAEGWIFPGWMPFH